MCLQNHQIQWLSSEVGRGWTHSVMGPLRGKALEGRREPFVHIIQDDGGIREDWIRTRGALWRAFWRNSGSRAVRGLACVKKAQLLQRSVVSCFQWKLSRWPFQKTVAISLDKVQCQMLALVLPCPRANDEYINHYINVFMLKSQSFFQSIEKVLENIAL